jgi:hypothetical protein
VHPARLTLETGRTTPAVVGMGALFAVVASAASYTGGIFESEHVSEDEDKMTMKEFIRRNRRRPIEETIAEVGEGRGMKTLDGAFAVG